jgi:hypothetical protein
VKYLRTDRVRVYPALPDLLGWQPGRFLADRAEAKQTSAPAERLGSVNVAAVAGRHLAITRPGRQRRRTLDLSLTPEPDQLTGLLVVRFSAVLP